MNPENRKLCKSAQERLHWLQSINAGLLPDELQPIVRKTQGLTSPLLRALTLALELDVDDLVIGGLGGRWTPLARALEPLPAQVDGRPIVGVSDLQQGISDALEKFFRHNPRENMISVQQIISHILSFQDTTQASSNLARATAEFVELSRKTTVLMSNLQQQSAELGIERFAQIFGAEARNHSRFLHKVPSESKWNYAKFGAAERWLFLGASLLTLPLPWFWNHAAIPDLTNLAAIIATVGQKLLFLSVWLFGIRFCFRNYSHHKYLAIQNIHRQNVLNSFRLLLEAIPSSDSQGRSTLMQEVAKNIYFGGKNPFLLASKSHDVDLQGVAELIKWMKS